MKKNLTKLMALGLVVVMGATAAVGCGSKDSGSKTKDGKTKLTFGMWSETQMANMQAMIDEYEKQNPNVEIEITVYLHGTKNTGQNSKLLQLVEQHQT